MTCLHYGLDKATGSNQKANEYAKKTRTSPADVVSFVNALLL